MDAKFWRAGMPSLMSKQRLSHHICLGLSICLLSPLLVSCGSGESEAVVENITPVVVPKPQNFGIRVPVEMRNVVVKIFDNFDNSLILQQSATTTTDLNLTLPKTLNTAHLYRVEISTLSDALIYDFLSGQYVPFSATLHALVQVNTNNLTQAIFISPSSEAVYQRALIRSGQLPNDGADSSTAITALQLSMATSDVNTALLNAFSQLDIKNLNPSYLLNTFTPQDIALNPSLYTTSYLSFGYLQQWAMLYPTNNYVEFTKNLAIDLKDGYLDGKQLRGDTSVMKSLLTPAPENLDPAKNTLLNIVSNQKTVRDQYATSLKAAVLKLAEGYQQNLTNPQGYSLLQKYLYSGIEPTSDSESYFRITGAGDYRRAVGFNNTTASCNDSIYPCKQGITGINLVNANLPSIEYLIGHYENKTSNCQLNIRADGTLELIKDTQVYRSMLDADSTDNMLQVDKTTHEYLLNSSSSTPNNSSLQYNFVQIQIRNNQVLSASAGLDNRKAPDQLQSTVLQCSFS